MAKDHQISFAYTAQLKSSRGEMEDTGDYTSLLSIHTKSQFHDFRLDYTTPFGLSAGAEYTYYHSPDEQRVKSSLLADDYDIASNQHVDKWHGYLKQEHDLDNDWTLNYGANFTTSRDKSSQDRMTGMENTSSGTTGNGTTQTEEQVSVYVGASKNFGSKLTAEVSLMGEYYHTPVWHEWSLFPTLSVTYHPTAGHILKLDIDTDRGYPTYWSVKDFTTYTFGGYGKIVGNPDLKPSKDFNASLTYIYRGRYVASLFVDNTTDDFYQLPYQSKTEKALEYKFTNFDHSLQVGLMLRVPVNVGKWWKNNITAIGVYQNQKDSQFYDLPFDRSKWFCMLKYSGSFIFSKHLLFNLDGQVRTAAIQGIADIPAAGGLNAALTWKPLQDDRLTVKASCNDIFQTADGNLHDTYHGQHVINEFHSGRSFILSLTYRFGGYKAKQHEKVDTSRFGI